MRQNQLAVVFDASTLPHDAARALHLSRVSTEATTPASLSARAVLSELGRQIADLLDVDVDDIVDDAFLATELDTDSLMDVALLVEDTYDVRFAESELLRFRCVGDIAECVSHHRRYLSLL